MLNFDISHIILFIYLFPVSFSQVQNKVKVLFLVDILSLSPSFLFVKFHFEIITDSHEVAKKNVHGGLKYSSPLACSRVRLLQNYSTMYNQETNFGIIHRVCSGPT